jgi:hypothetical protein
MLEKYAIKTIEGRDIILYTGKYWIATIRKLYDVQSEGIMIRCWGDVCDAYREIESYYILDTGSIPIDVEIECKEWKKISSNIADFSCEVRYKYVRYNGIIAVTIDPFDIVHVASDDELKLLLDLISKGVLLVRPM